MEPIHDDKYMLIGNQWYISQFEKNVVTFEQSNDYLKICYFFLQGSLKNLIFFEKKN